ncbi:MAG: hypothetical protein AAGB19_13640 [Cyanobacteria bacterium P01_F01_bin.3]
MSSSIGVGNPSFSNDRLDELEHTCFIIMPFGKKQVAGELVDFDQIYDEIFEPAVAQVIDADGNNANMRARRTDKDAFSGAITQEMFEYIMYSRLAFGDISGFNANVMYELGVRHAIQEAGTVLFRQAGHAIPFDIKTIKVFEYALRPGSHETVQKFIGDVISETLRRNRLDSPVRLALRSQWGGERALDKSTPIQPETNAGQEGEPLDLSSKQVVEDYLRDAEEAIFLCDRELAIQHYQGALRFDAENIVARMLLGLLLKEMGRYYEALEEFITVSRLRPDYGASWKEKGILQGLIARTIPSEARSQIGWLPDGYAALERATRLVPDDFDAWASLGGQLRNVQGDHERAALMYRRAAEISGGHPYPLLNALKEQAFATGVLDLKTAELQLQRARELRLAQAASEPPTDAPWCFFDLAEIELFSGNSGEFRKQLQSGVDYCPEDETWQIKTCLGTLKQLRDSIQHLAGLDEGITVLESELKKRGA